MRILFFAYCIKGWLELSDEIRSKNLRNNSRKQFLTLLSQKKILYMQYISGFKLLTRLRLNFSHLNEHKFRHNFKDTINPMCSCGFEPETTDHYLLRCKLYTDLRLDLLSNNVLLFGSENFTLDANPNILRRTIEFLKAIERFNSLLF